MDNVSSESKTPLYGTIGETYAQNGAKTPEEAKITDIVCECYRRSPPYIFFEKEIPMTDSLYIAAHNKGTRNDYECYRVVKQLECQAKCNNEEFIVDPDFKRATDQVRRNIGKIEQEEHEKNIRDLEIDTIKRIAFLNFEQVFDNSIEIYKEGQKAREAYHKQSPYYDNVPEGGFKSLTEKVSQQPTESTENKTESSSSCNMM
jgi:hypothetical protein